MQLASYTARRQICPYDSSGYPVESYYREDGMYIMNKAEKEKWDEDTKRIDQGGGATIPTRFR